MNPRGLILAGVTAGAMLVSGGVIASALNDLPQDAVPVQGTTADLNRQQTTPSTPPAQAAPVSPEQAGAAVPVEPVVVIAPPIEEAVEEEVAAVAPAPVVTSTEPLRRQRRRVAIVEAIDKITARSMRFEVEVGGRPVRFEKALIISARACEVSAGDEQVADAIAYLDVSLQPRGVMRGEQRQVFRGWMFASSPAVSSLQHPLYDAWIVGCKA
ncbi:DUF2155 domain-containing protein [Brevundimonas sp.]|uniref:DUF2155 domain-containing protein n=1 Tax=Brevundimonas sp. TaxID=1871086 RepID=UPI0035AF8760